MLKRGYWALTNGHLVNITHPSFSVSSSPEVRQFINYAFFPTVYCLYTVFSKPWDTASKFTKSAKKAHKEKKNYQPLDKGM